jgi:hypothetical protein
MARNVILSDPSVRNVPLERTPKLTRRQKEIAELLIMGYKIRELGVRFGMSYSKIYVWTQLPRFQRYQKKLEDDISTSMARKTFVLLDFAIGTLEKMLKSGNPDSQKFAIETVFRLNGKYQDKNNGGNPIGAGMNVNVIASHVDIGTLDPAKKENVKELLQLTRGAPSVKQDVN